MPTWLIRKSSSDEGDGPDPAQAGNPRSARRSCRNVAATSRLLREPGARGPPRRSRGRLERSRRGAHRLGADVRATARKPFDRELRDRAGRKRPGRERVSGSPRVAVVVFPGSQDDGDAELALESLGAKPVRVWHAEPELPDAE